VAQAGRQESIVKGGEQT
jgi:hypothetical protein